MNLKMFLLLAFVASLCTASRLKDVLEERLASLKDALEERARHRGPRFSAAGRETEESVAERLANLLEERVGHNLYCMYGVAYKYNRAYCMDRDEANKKTAGAPVSGAVGSNRCNGKQMTEQQCKSYANAEYGFTWERKASWSNYPKGCFKQLKNKLVYFNEHATGAGMADPPTKPVCVSE